MAHHSDGSSVQKHSAGFHYPYVVTVREAGFTGIAYVTQPDGTSRGGFVYTLTDRDGRIDAYAQAFRQAETLAAALRLAQGLERSRLVRESQATDKAETLERWAAADKAARARTALAEVKAYDARLDLREVSPTGEDYNNLFAIVTGLLAE